VQALADYFGACFRVPVLFCFIALAAFMAVFLKEIYPAVAAPLLRLLPHDLHVHLDTRDFITLYAWGSLGLYLARLVLRTVRGERPPVPYGRQFLWAGVVCTVGWGLVIAHTPWIRVSPGSTRGGMVGVLTLFYVLHLGAFAASIGLGKLADRFS
jgi:hypothetical protein